MQRLWNKWYKAVEDVIAVEIRIQFTKTRRAKTDKNPSNKNRYK